jgi:uncharacterized protein (DUF934 family)
MQRIIKDGNVQLDDWILVGQADSSMNPAQLPVKTILPFGYIQKKGDQLPRQQNVHGVLLDGSDDIEGWGEMLVRFPLLAVSFSHFTDGRGFSLAAQLREKYGFSGDLRAMGNFLPDQMNYLSRCGFSSFYIQDSEQLEDALSGLRDFNVAYQGL